MRLLFADDNNFFYDHPKVAAVGRTGDNFVELVKEDFIELPPGSTLVSIPGSQAVGISSTGKFIKVNKPGNGRAKAVGALLPQGYTRTFWPAYVRSKNEPPLPLMGYTAAAWHKGKVYVTAVKTDQPQRWDPAFYNSGDLPELVRKTLELMPGNRIVKQLSKCALEYGCFTAQNIFYQRWEGGIPVSPVCNARCLGCISLQTAECCPSPQSRISFKPTVEEVAQLGINHLENAEDAIISFGQGCEGEPSLAAGLISEAIKAIRHKTNLGTINMNTNAGNTENLDIICSSGLDSIRVSIISAREEAYNAYYRPQGYNINNVKASIKNAVKMGVYVSLNLLVSPGFNDREEEIESLLTFIKDTGIKLVQLRNLNIDPDFFYSHMPQANGEIVGIPGLIDAIKSIPGLEVGNFSRAIR